LQARATLLVWRSADIEESLERALQLRDRLTASSYVESAHARTFVRSEVYCGSNNTEEVPEAVDQLLGACSGISCFHFELVSDLRCMRLSAPWAAICLCP
jgi:hypothetical protein